VALAATLGWAMELLAVLDGGGEHEYDGVLEELVRRLEAPEITIDARGPRATPRAPYAPGVAGGDGPRMDEQSVADFGELFRRFLASVVETAPRGEAFFRDLLARHLGTEPEALPVTTQEFGSWEHGSLQRALDAYAAAPERTCELVGLLAGERYGGTAALTDLISDRGGKGGLRPGPVAYVNRQVAPGESLACIALGLLLVHDASGPLAVLVRQAPSPAGQPTLLLELMAPAEAAKSAFLGELRDLMHRHNVFRGRVVSFSGGGFMEESNVTFHERTDLPRDRIVLPDGVLERVERHVLGIAEHRARLLAAGRELKRGVLLHGPPGTGKTLTVTYLVGAMAEATVVVLVGAGLGMVGAACAIARSLQPSLVILEDVDLIAEVRTFPGGGGSLLFQLLNEMDGMAGDADVAFLLTTNRPDLLEPALAARPGRVDQAVEIPLPDADGRRRLLALYADGLGLPTDGLDDAVARTEGVSASFIKELLRQAALHAAERSPEALVVTTDDLSRTLDTLLDERAALTRVLLGGAPPRQRGGRDGFEDDDWPPGMPPPFMLDD
jgi:hypothetical protein